jgi:hypothetical protein
MFIALLGCHTLRAENDFMCRVRSVLACERFYIDRDLRFSVCIPPMIVRVCSCAKSRGFPKILPPRLTLKLHCLYFLHSLLRGRMTTAFKQTTTVHLYNYRKHSHPPSNWLRLFSSQILFRIDTPTILEFSHSTPTCLWRWNRQSVLKCRYIKFRRRAITQKKTYNISETVWFSVYCVYVTVGQVNFVCGVTGFWLSGSYTQALVRCFFFIWQLSW